MNRWWKGFKRGDTLKCICARDLHYSLVEGELYKAIEDESEGIFADRPYIKVQASDGEVYDCHSSRFEKVEA